MACTTTGNQGTGVIEGNYMHMDYIVKELILQLIKMIMISDALLWLFIHTAFLVLVCSCRFSSHLYV